MTKPIYVIVAHMGHDAPWLQIKTRKEVKNRVAYIKAEKPEHEHPLRLKLLKIVKKPLPPKLVKAYAAWVKAHAGRVKAYAAWAKAYAAQTAGAAWVKADAVRVQAYAAHAKADAAWEIALVSPEGIAFHQQVCGCAWTPEQPDILLQLAAQEEA